MDRDHLHATLTAEYDRYEHTRRQRVLSEAEDDQLFDVVVALSYLDDGDYIPRRVLIRMLCRLVTGEVVPTVATADVADS